MQLKMVVLPAPLGPINPWMRPASTFMLTPATARSPPKFTERSRRERSVTSGALRRVGVEQPLAYRPSLLAPLRRGRSTGLGPFNLARPTVRRWAVAYSAGGERVKGKPERSEVRERCGDLLALGPSSLTNKPLGGYLRRVHPSRAFD